MDEQIVLQNLKNIGEAPAWLTDEGYHTLINGYLLKGETPRQMYRRVADSCAGYLKKPELADKFYKYIDCNWMTLSTPVAANMGTNKGLNISCFGTSCEDDTYSILAQNLELGVLSKHGGGVSSFMGFLRGSGKPISRGGVTDTILGWAKCIESTVSTVSQGGTRRGSVAMWLGVYSDPRINNGEIEGGEDPEIHPDIIDFINCRRTTGDLSLKMKEVSFHHGIVLPDRFMKDLLAGNHKCREVWAALLEARIDTGEPFVMFGSSVNKSRPKSYVKNNLRVNASNLCSEITLHSDASNYSFVCCLGGINLAKWDELKDTDCIETSIWFLDGVMESFIQESAHIRGFERARASAIKGRALGLGVLGFHTLLQSKMIPMNSPEAMRLNNEIFTTIKNKADQASRDLAIEYGCPEWVGDEEDPNERYRNTHRTTLMPTVSSSLISGGVSQGIEPIAANVFLQASAKGNFVRYNPILKKLLQSKGKDSFDVWQDISNNGGSVQHLSFLTNEEKSVFETAREVDPKCLIRLAAQRQRRLCQSQSLNLFFQAPKEITPEFKEALGGYINDLMIEAWEMGVQTLYYSRSESVLKVSNTFMADECKVCAL